MSMEFDFGEVHPDIENDLVAPDDSPSRNVYIGPERRLGRRRKTDDRRGTLRFEPGKCIDRREINDRRILMHNYHPTVN